MADNLYRNNQYQYGSAARNYYTAPPLPQREDEKRPKAVPQKANDFAFVFKLFLCAAVLFSSIFVYVSMYASLNMKQSELKQLKNEIREAKSSVNEIKSVIATKLNLEHIQEVASTQLHMREPLPHQVVYIDLPENSYTVYQE